MADRLGIALTPVTAAKFSAGETNVQIHQSIREEDVYILQTSNVGSVNDNLMELLVLASGKRYLTAFVGTKAKQACCSCPDCFGSPLDGHLARLSVRSIRPQRLWSGAHHRQVSLLWAWASQCWKLTRRFRLVASLLKVAGVDHVVSYEIHASQVQGFFDIPVDNLSNITSTVSYIKEHIPGWRDSIIVSPDAGGAKR